MNVKKSLIAAAVCIALAGTTFAQTEPSKPKAPKEAKATDTTKKGHHHDHPKKAKEPKKDQ